LIDFSQISSTPNVLNAASSKETTLCIRERPALSSSGVQKSIRLSDATDHSLFFGCVDADIGLVANTSTGLTSVDEDAGVGHPQGRVDGPELAVAGEQGVAVIEAAAKHEVMEWAGFVSSPLDGPPAVTIIDRIGTSGIA
jgi:hypothetical protein